MDREVPIRVTVLRPPPREQFSNVKLKEERRTGDLAVQLFLSSTEAGQSIGIQGERNERTKTHAHTPGAQECRSVLDRWIGKNDGRARLKANLRRMSRFNLIFITALSFSFVLSACAPEKPADKTTVMLCAKASFRARDRADILEARRLFYEAALLLRKDFSDTSETSRGNELAPWSNTRAQITTGFGPAVTLGGHSDYPLTNGGDPASDMDIYLFDKRPPDTVIPCDKHARALYGQVIEVMSKKWTITDSGVQPHPLRPDHSVKPTPSPRLNSGG